MALFQQDSYKNCADDKDIVSCEWTRELFINSTSSALVKRIEEKYEALTGPQQGGITYIKIALDEMFNMLDIVITSLQDFFNTFARNGVAKFPNENVALLVQQINAVADRLAEAGALPQDTPLNLLTGFTKCSVPEFVGPFYSFAKHRARETTREFRQAARQCSVPEAGQVTYTFGEQSLPFAQCWQALEHPYE